MKLYIVTETNHETNALLRTWVCFTEDQAKDCLKARYDLACSYNRIAGVDDPTNCLEMGFFFWEMQNGMRLRYDINESKTFSE